MPLTYYTGNDEVVGSSNDDVILGLYNGTSVGQSLYGGDGDDLITTDATGMFLVSSATSNNSLATAFSIDNPLAWSTSENPLISDWSIPHTQVAVNATVGEAEFFEFTVLDGQTITIDIDFGANSPIGDNADLAIDIVFHSGIISIPYNTLVSNDDGFVFDTGSSSDYDPYLTYTFSTGGTYYIRVHPYNNNVFTAPASFVMNVSLTGHEATGNTPQSSDFADGGIGDDVILGQGGDDELVGGAGNDLLIGGSGADTLNGGEGDDIIYGREAENTFGESYDTVDGGAGNDIIYSSGSGHYMGGDGDDVIVANFTVLEELMEGGAGTDTLDVSYTDGITIDMSTGTGGYANESYLNFENLVAGNGSNRINGNNAANIIETGSGDDRILGRGGADSIFAGSGNNLLNGGTGNDHMEAGSGNDIYYIDSLGDTIIDGGGSDLIRTTISYTLQSDMENLQLLTTGNINATGNALNNVIWGNAGNNVIDGGVGADIMRGGNGDDTYYVDNVGDRAVEAGKTGYDTVYSSVNFTLYDGVERLILTTSADLNGYGTAGDNALYGNSGNNILNGRGGTDSLFGNAGDDRLYGEVGDDNLQGGEGNDLLQGGAGRDVLTGGTGLDGFIFADGDFGTTTATADRITDFSHVQGDRIRLNLSDANVNAAGDQAYAFIGTQAFHHVAGELRYQQISGNTYVYGDTNGDGTADWIVRLDGLHALVVGDFIL